MALTPHPFTLPHVFLIRELASISPTQRFFPHNGPTASIAKRCLILAQELINHSGWKERYSCTSPLVTIACEYGSESSIILLSICHLASLFLIALYTKSSQAIGKLSCGTLILLQSSQLRNAISIFARAHYLSLRHLVNRLTAKKPAGTQPALHDTRYSNRTANTAS